MTDTVIVALIAAVPLSLGALVPLVLAWRTRKDMAAVKSSVAEVKISIDGRLEEFMKLAKSSSFAAGQLQANDANRETDKERTK